MEKPAGKIARGKILLIVSLALNLIVIGLVVGAYVAGPHGSGAPVGMRGYVAALTKTQRHDLLQNSQRGILDHLKVIKQLNRGQSGILDAIGQEPFSQEALSTAMQTQRDQVSEVTQKFHLALADTVARMTPQERVTFVERYQKRGENRWGRRHQQYSD